MTTQINVSTLEGRKLDYFTALCLGWVWAKNVCGRSGDSFDQYRDSKHKARWPIGARCLIPGHKATKLHESEKNWDGWIKCRMTDPIAPAAFDDVPKFSQSWAALGDYIDNAGIGFTVNHNDGCPPDLKVTAFHPSVAVEYQGPTHCVAACRAIVASVFGPVICEQEQASP